MSTFFLITSWQMLSLEVRSGKDLWLWGHRAGEPRVFGEEEQERPGELGEWLSWEGVESLRLREDFSYLILMDVLCLVPDILGLGRDCSGELLYPADLDGGRGERLAFISRVVDSFCELV